MSASKDELLKEAERLEELAKNTLKRKQYTQTISILMKAKNLYAKIGLGGQEAILIKKIVHVQNLIKRDQEINNDESSDGLRMDSDDLEIKGNELLENARNLALNEKYEDALREYNKAYEIFNKTEHHFETKQILWQINEIREYLKWKSTGKGIKSRVAIKDIVTLASAEKRRAKIQSNLTTSSSTNSNPSEIEPLANTGQTEFKKPKLFQQMNQQIREEEIKQKIQSEVIKHQQDIRKSKIQEKREKLKKIQEEKRKQEELQAEVEKLLDFGSKAVKDRNYTEATSFYEKAIKILNTLGWFNQVGTLKKELRNIEIYKKQEERERIQKTITQQKYEEEFRKRVDKVKQEKERLTKKLTEKRDEMPFEIKQKLAKIELIKKKADKEEELKKYQRVISRYQYILSIYNSIPDIYDFSNEISLIQNKLTYLKGKE